MDAKLALEMIQAFLKLRCDSNLWQSRPVIDAVLAHLLLVAGVPMTEAKAE